HPLVIGDFDDGTTQGWTGVRMPAIESVGGVLTNINTAGLGSDGNGDSWVWLNTGSNPLYTVGELPGQYDIVQFDIRLDTLPPQPADSRIRGRHFLQGDAFGGGNLTHGVTYAPSSSYPTDNNWRTYTIVRDFNDAAWEGVINRVRIDMVDGVPNAEPAPVLGAKFSIDNVILGRTTTTEAFPAISPVQPNIVKNGDLSDTSNVSLTGTNQGAFNINGGNGNFGPFRGNTGDVDHWTPYNNNPNMIVEAVNGPDGTGLNLLHTSNGNQGSFYLDTHYSVSAEQFSLNSAGGYQNGLIQTNVLNGVTIDPSANYELSFDLNFNDTRPANPSSDFTVALTVGTNSTDPNSAVTGSLFDDNLGNITAGDRQTLTISGADLLAAQGSGEVNLIVQTQANTSIVNFPGTPVPNNHVDSAVFTQVQVDNFSLIKEFVQVTGDVNKDGVVTQADVNLATDYLNGNGGETAAKRQNDLANAPSAPFASDILASLNLADFDLTGNDFFDQADVDAIAALVTTVAGDFDGDGDFDGADFLGLQQSDASQIPDWEASYGTSSAVASNAAVPEPSSLILVGFAIAAASMGGRRRS
ncbi:MAG: PEP-CTERM sorting domain-containing protein, partial [Lacipirellulaceae bacterium]